MLEGFILYILIMSRYFKKKLFLPIYLIILFTRKAKMINGINSYSNYNYTNTFSNTTSNTKSSNAINEASNLVSDKSQAVIKF